MEPAEYWIENLHLQRHPEGGWFREIYRSEGIIGKNALPGNFAGDRNCSTSIYYMLEKNDFSSFHRIKSDEIWHYYAGSSAVEILVLEEGKFYKHWLGPCFKKGENFQVAVPQNRWFAARLKDQNGYALVGCTVSPGFHFEDFELAGEELIGEYPGLEKEIRSLLR